MAKDRVPILLPPPTYPALGLLAAWGLERVLPGPDLPLWASLLGALPLAAAALLFGWSFSALRRHRTTIDPYRPTTAIVRDGPYRFTRNPIYCGFLLAQAGIGLLAEWLWAIALLPIVWGLLSWRVVRKEEAYLSGKFGEEYAGFRRDVRRWL